MKYVVRTSRTEAIDYELEADSPEDAEERYMMDGDEIASDTTDTYLLEVMPASDYHEAANQ